MTLYSLIGSIARPALNVAGNSLVAYLTTSFFSEHTSNRVIVIIVAIDTVFRIAITHVLDAIKISYLQTGSAGHLLFPCLTLLTQPLSIKIAQRFFNAPSKWSEGKSFMRIFGYIALSWKMNMMAKDMLYMCYPALKRA
jgi:hypothetical protein